MGFLRRGRPAVRVGLIPEGSPPAGGPWLRLLLFLCAPACTAAWAPPARTGMLGAPQQLDGGNVRIAAGAWTALGALVDSAATVAVGVADGCAVEGGAETLVATEHGDVLHALGFLGTRVIFVHGPDGDAESPPRPPATFDLEIGGALGAGGTNSEDDLEPLDRFAGGAYLGAGVGIPFGDSAIGSFMRARVQVTGAERVPPTLWWSVALGVDALLPPVSLYAGWGIVGFYNEILGGVMPYQLELGVAVDI